jgi:hypothetical protein
LGLRSFIFAWLLLFLAFFLLAMVLILSL